MTDVKSYLILGLCNDHPRIHEQTEKNLMYLIKYTSPIKFYEEYCSINYILSVTVMMNQPRRNKMPG